MAEITKGDLYNWLMMISLGALPFSQFLSSGGVPAPLHSHIHLLKIQNFNELYVNHRQSPPLAASFRSSYGVRHFTSPSCHKMGSISMVTMPHPFEPEHMNYSPFSSHAWPSRSTVNSPSNMAASCPTGTGDMWPPVPEGSVSAKTWSFSSDSSIVVVVVSSCNVHVDDDGVGRQHYYGGETQEGELT